MWIRIQILLFTFIWFRILPFLSMRIRILPFTFSSRFWPSNAPSKASTFSLWCGSGSGYATLIRSCCNFCLVETFSSYKVFEQKKLSFSETSSLFEALLSTWFRCVTMLITSLSVPGTHLDCKPSPYGTWTKRYKHSPYGTWTKRYKHSPYGTWTKRYKHSPYGTWIKRYCSARDRDRIRITRGNPQSGPPF
jgi:hypothetical protein